MKNLPDTSTEQGQRGASVMLARLCGWDVSYGLIDSDQLWDGFAHDTLHITADTGEWCDNLYDPANMALAWRVLNWATTQSVTVKAQKGGGDDIWQEPWTTFIDDEINGKYEIYMMTPADAQRAWLDKILTLAIESGMIEATVRESWT